MNSPYDEPMTITAHDTRSYLNLCRYAYKVRQSLRRACVRDVGVKTDATARTVTLVVKPYRKTPSAIAESIAG